MYLINAGCQFKSETLNINNIKIKLMVHNGRIQLETNKLEQIVTKVLKTNNKTHLNSCPFHVCINMSNTRLVTNDDQYLLFFPEHQ